MAEQILTPSLNPVASPTDRFVSPQMDTSSSQLGQLAKGLSKLNPKINKIIGEQYKRKAEEDYARGQNAAQGMGNGFELERNRDGWRQLIEQTRKEDRENGTNNADTLVGASPHFRRGLVQAKTERIAMGLDDHLAQQWEENAGGIKEMDDPAAVQAWTQEQTQAYSERMGVENIDPVMLAETFNPRALQAQDQLTSKHMQYRSRARVAEYQNEFQAGLGMSLAGGGAASSSVRDFITRLGGSESSNNSRADRTNKDGRRYAGELQFGQARLDEFNAATGLNVTLDEFKASEAIQSQAALWHINDIDEEIDAAGYVAQGMSRDGLRAVAHLGGIGGMHEFARSGGRSNGNVSDELGTSLSDYYRKFSGVGVADIQRRMDTAVANGVAGKKVNEMTVEAVVAQARQMGDASILTVLDDINTGNGPLGNVGWVKEARIRAETQIENDHWRDEQRARQVEKQERSDARRAIFSQSITTLMEDPFADIDDLQEQAMASGNPDLARDMHNLQRQLQTEVDEVPVNPEALVDLHRRIDTGEVTADEARSEIAWGTGINYGSSEAIRMLDKVERQENSASSDYLRDPEVQSWFDDSLTIIEDANTEVGVLGEVISSGKPVRLKAKAEMVDMFNEFIAQNPEATREAIRMEARKISREVAKQEDYRGRSPEASNSGAADVADSATGPVDRTSAAERTAAQETGEVADPLAGFTDEELSSRWAGWQETTGRTMGFNEWKAEVRRAEGYVPEETSGSWWNPFD